MESQSKPEKRFMTLSRGQQRGPFLGAELLGLAREGALSPLDSVCLAGSDRWVLAYQVKGLFPAPFAAEVKNRLAHGAPVEDISALHRPEGHEVELLAVPTPAPPAAPQQPDLSGTEYAGVSVRRVLIGVLIGIPLALAAFVIMLVVSDAWMTRQHNAEKAQEEQYRARLDEEFKEFGSRLLHAFEDMVTAAGHGGGYRLQWDSVNISGVDTWGPAPLGFITFRDSSTQEESYNRLMLRYVEGTWRVTGAEVRVDGAASADLAALSDGLRSVAARLAYDLQGGPPPRDDIAFSDFADRFMLNMQARWLAFYDESTPHDRLPQLMTLRSSGSTAMLRFKMYVSGGWVHYDVDFQRHAETSRWTPTSVSLASDAYGLTALQVQTLEEEMLGMMAVVARETQ